MEGMRIKGSRHIKMQLHQSTVGLNTTPRLCVTGVTLYLFASKEVEPDVETASIAIAAQPFAALKVDFGHSFME